MVVGSNPIVEILQMFISPLEQFSIIKLIPISFGIVDISFTNSSLLTVLSCLLAIIFYSMACSNAKLIPSA